jgi:protein-S-isoprenylcysteine O-methyltransferase Ste14
MPLASCGSGAGLRSSCTPWINCWAETLPAWSPAAGYCALAAGGIVAACCLWAFVTRGRGTPALFDAPPQLVARGPYCYTRNPMYIGGALLLLGFGLYQRSPAICLFVPVWWLLFHLLVVRHEEPTLRGKFGPEYDEYCRRTPRWIPRFLPGRKQTWTPWSSSRRAV